MSCSCKSNGAKKQPSALSQIVKTPKRVSSPNPTAPRPAKRVIVRRPI